MYFQLVDKDDKGLGSKRQGNLEIAKENILVPSSVVKEALRMIMTFSKSRNLRYWAGCDRAFDVGAPHIGGPCSGIVPR